MEEQNESGGKGLKISMIIIGIVLMVGPIVMLATGVDMPKWIVFGALILGILSFFGAFLVGAPEREAKRYVKENGDFDMDTPRSYTTMSVSRMQHFVGSGSPFKRNYIKEFAYADRAVRIEMVNGDVLEAPLAEIEMIVRKNPKGEGATGYELRHNGIKIFPMQDNVAFDDLEVEDMWNILYRAGNVHEPNSLKILSVASKLVSMAEDVAGSGDSSVMDTVVSKGKDKMVASKDVQILGNTQEESLEQEDSTVNESDEKTEPATPMVPPASEVGFESPQQQPGRKCSRFVKVLLWTLGVVTALFLALVVIGLVADDEETEEADAVEIAEFDEQKVAYLLGGTESKIMLIPVQMTKDAKITTATVTMSFANNDTILFNVEEGGPGHYLLRADGNPGVWGAQVLDLTLSNKDDKLVWEGTFSDTAGPEEPVSFVIMQTDNDDEKIYLGNIGDAQAFMDITFSRNSEDGLYEGFKGTLLVLENGSEPITVSGSMESWDEGCTTYSVSAPEMSMTLTDGCIPALDGYGFMGEAETAETTLPVRLLQVR